MKKKEIEKGQPSICSLVSPADGLLGNQSKADQQFPSFTTCGGLIKTKATINYIVASSIYIYLHVYVCIYTYIGIYSATKWPGLSN